MQFYVVNTDVQVGGQPQRTALGTLRIALWVGSSEAGCLLAATSICSGTPWTLRQALGSAKSCRLQQQEAAMCPASATEVRVREGFA